MSTPAPVDKITIRMYNTGSVGDCFLLLFEKKNKPPFSMLIDCGGYKTKKSIIHNCVKHIQSSLPADTIDLVVVTHEHEDHVSGFNQARDLFDKIKFRQVWMSWAENEKDPLAKKLYREKGKKIKALKAVVEKNLTKINRDRNVHSNNAGLNRSIHMRKQHFQYALATLEFEDASFNGSPGVRLKISDAMNYVKGKCPTAAKSKMFKKPGQVITLKGAEGIKFHILGPPYHSDLHGIKNDMQHDEMYSLAKRLGMRMDNFAFQAIHSQSDNEGLLVSPFPERYHMDESDTRKFNRNYYCKRSNKWRQIEYDWLDSINDLSIALTDYVNNTSFAMALEIESTGEVLLFPADAQSGNWISWQDKGINDDFEKASGKKAAELLKRTVFYKVGHHGSHNGTASLSGLDLMKEKKMVAFMPLVQEKVPARWGGSKNFPAKALYKKIIERTNGAVIRTDIGLIKDAEAAELRTRNYSAADIAKLEAVSANPLYHEWVIDI